MGNFKATSFNSAHSPSARVEHTSSQELAAKTCTTPSFYDHKCVMKDHVIKRHLNDSAALAWTLESRLKKCIPLHRGCTSGHTIGSTSSLQHGTECVGRPLLIWDAEQLHFCHVMREKLWRRDWFAESPSDLQTLLPGPCLTRLGNPPLCCSACEIAAFTRETDI